MRLAFFKSTHEPASERGWVEDQSQHFASYVIHEPPMTRCWRGAAAGALSPFTQPRSDSGVQYMALIAKAKAGGAPVITIVYSGRPLAWEQALTDSNAFVAAWLPGSEGLGMTDVLFGDYEFTGKMPRRQP